MKNSFHPSTFRRFSCRESGKWTILTVVLVLVILYPVFSCYPQSQNASQLMAETSRNVQKHRQGNAAISFRTEGGEPVQGATVEIEQQSQDFLFGNIIFPLVGVLPKFRDIDVYQPEVFKSRFKGVFNMAIMPFYWALYEQTAGQTQWQRIFPALEWCKQNGITPKGHPLAWVESGGTPRWLYDLPTDLTEDILKSRITRIVKGFKGDIDVWDVVNEPTHTISWSSVMKKPYGDRYTSIPIKEIADWVEPCFRWARLANPEAELVLNDYEQISSTFILDTRERFYELAKELLKRGSPLDGLGLQAHEPRSEWYSPQKYWETLGYYAELGLPLHITEFVAESSGEEIIGGWKTGTWTPEAQAEYAEQIYRLSFGHPSVESINWWGLSDRYIWNERPQGGLINENYRPKPVYRALQRLIKQEWMTRTSARTAEDGSVDFRGFYGDYKITLETKEGNVHTFDIHIGKREANRWEFRI